MTIAERLVICREATGKSRAEVARALNMAYQSLRGLETGDSKRPSAWSLIAMRDRLGYDPDYIMKGTGMPLLARFEELAAEQALLAMFRELGPNNRQTVIQIVQGIRRAQGDGPSASDPWQEDPPKV